MDYHISDYTVSFKSLLLFAFLIGALSFASSGNAAPKDINRTITPSVYVAPGQQVAYYVRYYNRPYYSPYYRTYYRPYYRPYYYRPYYRPYYYNRYYYRW